MSETLPTPGGRTVLEQTTVSKDDEWWTVVVRDRDPRTGQVRLRLERLVLDATEGWKLVHSWRVRPEFWAEEVRLWRGSRTEPARRRYLPRRRIRT